MKTVYFQRYLKRNIFARLGKGYSKMFVIAFEVENKIFLTYHSICGRVLPKDQGQERAKKERVGRSLMYNHHFPIYYSVISLEIPNFLGQFLANMGALTKLFLYSTHQFKSPILGYYISVSYTHLTLPTTPYV